MCAGSPRLRSAPDRRPIVQPLAHRTRSPGIHGARRPVRTRAASRCHAPGHRRTLQLNALPAAPTCTPLSASFVTPQRIRTGPDHRCREDHERTRRYIHTDHHGESHYGTAPSSPSGRTQTRPPAYADERVRCVVEARRIELRSTTAPWGASPGSVTSWRSVRATRCDERAPS